MIKTASNKKATIPAVKGKNRLVDYILLFVISLLLIITPFYRGLYFRENILPAIIVISVAFISYIAYMLVTKEKKFKFNYLEVLMLLLPVAYVISFFVSVNMKSGFDSILKYASYFMLFILVSRLTKDLGKPWIIYSSVLISLLLVAVTGMMTIGGYLDLNGVTEYNRLYGLYQYPNTTGAMLGAGMLLCIGLTKPGGKKLINVLLQVILVNLFAGFVMTLSFGAFLVFAAVALIYFLIVDSKVKLNQIFLYIITVLSSIPILISYFNGSMDKTFLASYLAASFMAVVLHFLYIYFSNKYLSGLSGRASSILVLSLVAFILIAVILAISVGHIVPQSLIDRIWNEELKIGNAADRLTFTKDAVRMFMDSPLLGAGGGAWQDIYFQYQSFAYNSTEAHNFYVQLAVETGVIGIAIIAGVLFFLCKWFIKTMRVDKDSLLIPAYFGIFMILGHALLDFDLSLAAPMFLLMALMGIVNGLNVSKNEKTINSAYPIYGFAILATVILSMSTTTYMGILNGNRAAAQISSSMDKAESLYAKAMKLDKYNCAIKIDYAQIMLNKLAATKDEAYLKKMINTLDEIEKYEPYNWKYKPTIISLLLSVGKLEEGLAMTDNMVRMKPLEVNAYLVKMQVNLQIADYFYKNKKYDEAIKYLDHTIATQEELQAAAAKSIKPVKIPEQIKETVEQAKALKGSIANKQ